MHQIRQGLQALPIPASASHKQLSRQVFRGLRRSRSKVISLWGGGAIAALFVAGIVSNLPKSSMMQTARNSTTIETPVATEAAQPTEEALVVALNRPMLQIPKLATTTEDNKP